MSTSITVKTQTGNIYLNNAKEGVNNHYRNDNVWDVYAKFDTNQNKNLEASEIDSFNQFIKKAAGTDNVLDAKELKSAATSLGVSSDKLSKAISLLSADVIADNLAETMKPKVFGKVDKEAVKNLLSQVDKNNVSEIWSQYQSLIDKRNSVAGLVLLKDNSLVKDIFDNFSFEEAVKILKPVVTSMYQAAKDKNINVKTLISYYNTALKKGDKEGMDAAVRELGARLNFATRMSDRVDSHLAKMGDDPKMNQANLMQAKNIAAKSGLKATSDIVGDGVLGNTKSKALTVEGKVVLDALNKLLKDERMNERINACITKEKDCFTVYFPNANMMHSSTEYGLMTEKYIQNGVVGDGDMTILVAAIMRRADNSKVSIQTQEEAEKFITNVFTPELFGRTRLLRSK